MAKPPHTRAAMRAFYPVCQVAELAAGYGYTTRWSQTCISRPQTGHERSWTSKAIRLKVVPAGQRYAMVVPSWFFKVCRCVMPTAHHSIITTFGGKTILAFRRIVQKKRRTSPVIRPRQTLEPRL